jgi:hypothetical protein
MGISQLARRAAYGFDARGGDVNEVESKTMQPAPEQRQLAGVAKQAEKKPNRAKRARPAGSGPGR